MRSTPWYLSCVTTALLLAACSADRIAPTMPDQVSLITRGGELAGDSHPETVLLVFEVDGQPAWRCSGTLISPTVVLTAGHCTDEPGVVSGARVFTESDVDNGNNNYPFAGPNSVEAVAWASHPEFTNAAFVLHDVGVVRLAAPVSLPSYGQLPAVNQLESMRPGQRSPFTAVGFGVQRTNPSRTIAARVRMFATPHLLQINTGYTGSYSIMLSNNASSGGTCFGDSGGPNYIGSSMVIGGVTSFGKNGNCAGTGGVFRLDRADVLSFVRGFMAP
jgi:secreted trypsin-like serine protease